MFTDKIGLEMVLLCSFRNTEREACYINHFIKMQISPEAKVIDRYLKQDSNLNQNGRINLHFITVGFPALFANQILG